MNITIEKRQTYSEVYEFLNLLDIEFINKIPAKLLNFFKIQRDLNYVKNINPCKKITNQGLKRDTIAIIDMINLKYWASPEEKEALTNKFKQNYIKNQEELKEKYNIDNMFKNYTTVKIETINPNDYKEEINTEIIKVNNNIFSKILNFFKKIFKK